MRKMSEEVNGMLAGIVGWGAIDVGDGEVSIGDDSDNG